MSVRHEEFRTVPYRIDRLGWKGYLWRAECKACPWAGPEQRHPLDCGPDAVEHESRAHGPEVMSPTEGAESCVA